MAQRTELTEVQDAWRALHRAEDDGAAGWKTIRVAAGAPCHIRAGRRHPGNEEALLVGFDQARLPRAEQLPTGRGFAVSEEDLRSEGNRRSWIALRRETAGSRELFDVVVDNLLHLLLTSDRNDDASTLRSFLARIRAWQEFMQRGHDGVLGPESEEGLLGELWLLRSMIGAGVSPYLAVVSWAGPAGGIQDFALGGGAIEVKTTVAATASRITVGCLEQLDNDTIRPLYLALVRLSLRQEGQTLTEAVDEIRTLLDPDPAARREFDNRLLQGGFFDSAASHYTRRFSHVASRLFVVESPFPRLVRSNVSPGVIRVRYEVDLDLCPLTEVGLAEALNALGGTAR